MRAPVLTHCTELYKRSTEELTTESAGAVNDRKVENNDARAGIIAFLYTLQYRYDLKALLQACEWRELFNIGLTV
jgi:hypothetical protein